MFLEFLRIFGVHSPSYYVRVRVRVRVRVHVRVRVSAGRATLAPEHVSHRSAEGGAGSGG